MKNKSCCIQDHCGLPYDMDELETRDVSTLRLFWQMYCPKHREDPNPNRLVITGVPTLHHKLIHAVTEYDRKQQGKRGYNMYALPQYLARIEQIESDIAKGTAVRKALLRGFNGRLLDACLKAIGEPKFTREEMLLQSYTY